jgi:hypothetical protein
VVSPDPLSVHITVVVSPDPLSVHITVVVSPDPLSVHITVVVSPDPLSPPPSASSAIKIPEITGEDPDVSEPVAEGNIQIEYC